VSFLLLHLPGGRGGGAVGELAGQRERLGEQGGAGGSQEAVPSRAISGCPGGEVPPAGLMVMPEPWRGLPRGSPPGGAGSVTVTVTGPPPRSRAMASATVRSSP